MSKLPVISGRECIKVLGKVKFYPKRQEGSLSRCEEMSHLRKLLFLITKSWIEVH